MEDLIRKLRERLQKLETWKKSGEWADPYSPRYTNGYDKAVSEEMEFLRNLLNGLVEN